MIHDLIGAPESDGRHIDANIRIPTQDLKAIAFLIFALGFSAAAIAISVAIGLVISSA